ncbi:MAG: hypothetical protein ABIM89_10700 [Mycobacteriales bacterium]
MGAAIRTRVARSRDDAGSAMVEFILLVGPLFIPLVYLIIGAFEVQRTAFAVSEGARQAGRAYVTGRSTDDALERALFAANLAIEDQGLPALKAADLDVVAPSDICRGGSVTVTLNGKSSLPFLPKGFASIPVSASHTEVIDELRSLPAC